MSKGSVASDDELLGKAQQSSGFKAKRALVHAALEFLVRLEAQKRVLRYRGRGVRKNKLINQ